MVKNAILLCCLLYMILLQSNVYKLRCDYLSLPSSLQINHRAPLTLLQLLLLLERERGRERERERERERVCFHTYLEVFLKHSNLF